MSEQTFAKIKKIVADELSVSEEDVKLEASFKDDLGADSLALVELIMALEDQFELDSISDEDAAKIITVKDAVDYIDGRLGL